MNNPDKKNKVQGFALVEIIIAITIIAILGSLFAPSFTEYIDEAYRAKASVECSYVITAAQSEITNLYAQGKLKSVLDKGSFTITSNKIKRVKKSETLDNIIELSETGGTIQALWVDENDIRIAGLAYLNHDAEYYIIYAPLAENGETKYIFSAEEESDEYKKQLQKLESSKWK